MFLSSISFLTFCSSIVMGIIGLRLDPKSGKNISLAVFSFIVSFWAFGDIFYYTVTDKTSGWFWYRFTSIGWCGMIFGIFYVCTEFAGYYKRIPLIVKVSFVVYSIALIVIQFNSTLFLKDFHQTPKGLIEDIDVLSPGFFLQYGGMLAALVTGIFFIIKKIVETLSNRERRMLILFILLCLLCSFMGIGLNVIQVFLNTPVPPFGSVFMLVFIAGILYLTQKYRLLRIDYRLLQNEAFDIISDFIIIISPDNKIINVNNAVKHSIKLTGAYVSDLFINEEEFEQYLKDAVSTKNKIEKKHVLFRSKNNENISSYISICPVFDKFDDYTGSILIASPLYEFEKIINEYKISPQEKKLIFLLREGFMNKEIAIKMEISEGVVKNYIYSIYQKTKVNNRVELLQLFFPAET